MRVYLHSDMAEKQASYVVNIAPAGDTLFHKPDDYHKGDKKSADRASFPSDWSHADGDAKQFQITFVFGVADVDDQIGKYMVARGIAKSNRMLRRVKQLFDRHGHPIEEVFDSEGKRILFDTEAAAA
jgi:hypothetical protein